MPKSVEIRRKIDAVSEEAEAILNLAEKDKDGMTPDQQSRWDAIMSPEGELAVLQRQLDSQIAVEAEQKRLRDLRVSLQAPLPLPTPVDGSPAPAPRAAMVRSKLRAFVGTDAARDAYAAGQWLKAISARMSGHRDQRAEQLVEARGWGQYLNTATESTPSAGGYLVPDPLSAAIINVRELSGVSRRLARVVPMTSDTLTMPKKTGRTSVKYPGEAANIVASDQTWGQVQLTTVKRAVLSKVSQELIDDAIISIVDDLAMEIGSDLAIQEDNELVNGDGTSTYGGETGLLSSIGSAGVVSADTGHDTWAELILLDFTNTMAKLPAKYWPFGPTWVCSPAFYYGVMLRVLAEAGGNTISALEAGAGRQSFLGYPVALTHHMPTATAVSLKSVLFGVFDQAVIIGDRVGIRFAQSDQYAFNEDVLTVRATTRYDINVHEPGTAGVVGAYVALATTAS